MVPVWRVPAGIDTAHQPSELVRSRDRERCTRADLLGWSPTIHGIKEGASMPGNRKLPATRRRTVLLIAFRMVLALGLLAAVWMPGHQLASRPPVPARAATLDTYAFGADPTVGPAGGTVSISGSSFDPGDSQYQWQIGFDDVNRVIATVTLATCSPS